MTAEERIFSIVRGGLYAKLPSLALPLGRLTCREGDVDPAGTDGEAAVFAPGLLRREFLAESDLPERLTLHLLLHLMLGHPWGRQGRARALWDTACDLAVGLVRHALLPQEPETHLGKYAELRRQYLMQHRRVLYTNLKTSGQLAAHLAEIEETAQKMVTQAVAQMAKAEGVTEELKAADPQRWTGLMNDLKHSAEEAVLSDLIYS